MDNRLLEIVSNKPELMAEFPSWMLPERTVHELKGRSNVAIAEIAGRDSVAAVIEAVRLRNLEAILPTIAYNGADYGNWEYPFQKTEFLRKKFRKSSVNVYSPVVLGAPRFWWKLCGRYATHLFKALGFYTPCIGCHLYFHAVRIPLAKRLNCHLLIGGERESHDGRVKINQIGIVLDAYIDLLATFGIELLLPLRDIRSGEEIEHIIGQDWQEGTEQLKCVMNKNYVDEDGTVEYSENGIRRFLSEFAMKLTEEEIRGLVE